MASSDLFETLSFYLNNLTEETINETAKHLKAVLTKHAGKELALDLIHRRVALEPNHIDLYVKLVLSVDSKAFHAYLIIAAIKYVTALLKAESDKRPIIDQIRSLGSFLGRVTYGQGIELPRRVLNPVEMLVMAQKEDGERIKKVVTFVVNLMEGCKDNKVFHPSHPRIQPIFDVLRQIYVMENIKMNIKFEIEIFLEDMNALLPPQEDPTPSPSLIETPPPDEPTPSPFIDICSSTDSVKSDVTEDHKTLDGFPSFNQEYIEQKLRSPTFLNYGPAVPIIEGIRIWKDRQEFVKIETMGVCEDMQFLSKIINSINFRAMPAPMTLSAKPDSLCITESIKTALMQIEWLLASVLFRISGPIVFNAASLLSRDFAAIDIANFRGMNNLVHSMFRALVFSCYYSHNIHTAACDILRNSIKAAMRWLHPRKTLGELELIASYFLHNNHHIAGMFICEVLERFSQESAEFHLLHFILQRREHPDSVSLRHFAFQPASCEEVNARLPEQLQHGADGKDHAQVYMQFNGISEEVKKNIMLTFRNIFTY